MLSRDNDVGNRHRPITLVSDAHLAFAIRTQPGHLTCLAHLSQPVSQTVSQDDGKWYELVGFVGGVTKHDALIPCSLLREFIAFGVHAAFVTCFHPGSDIWGLFTNG